jgi:hypothetical protein
MSITMKYFVVQVADGAYLRFRKADHGSHAIVVESCVVSEEGEWIPRISVPPTTAGYVAHTLALLQVMELVFGRQGSFVKGSEEDVKRLGELLRTLS